MRTARAILFLFVVLALPACGQKQPSPQAQPAEKQALADARRGFKTNEIKQHTSAGPLPAPPKGVFIKTKYESPIGKLGAYLTPDPKDGQKHPAIIWITGGDCNSVDDDIWKDAPPSNDQTASAFRKAGIVMMFPSLRGGNDNPGVREGFYGEVNDIEAAVLFLRQQPYVDASRIYLGGHSTGGTLVLLAGECSDWYRAVFSFGPVADVNGYPPEFKHFDANSPREAELRSPVYWLHSIKSPVFVFEGTRQENLDSLQAMKRVNTNKNVQFFAVAGVDHFSILAPVTKLLAEKVLADTGETCNISFSEEELKKATSGK